MHLVDLGDRYTYIHTYLCSYKIVIAGFGGGLNWEQGGLFVILNIAFHVTPSICLKLWIVMNLI